MQTSPPRTGAPVEFAARGGLELALHTHDIASGLGVPFRPADDLCRRLLDTTADYPGHAAAAPPGDAWTALLVRSGRPAG
jgi:hypothetical protein